MEFATKAAQLSEWKNGISFRRAHTQRTTVRRSREVAKEGWLEDKDYAKENGEEGRGLKLYGRKGLSGEIMLL